MMRMFKIIFIISPILLLCAACAPAPAVSTPAASAETAESSTALSPPTADLSETAAPAAGSPPAAVSTPQRTVNAKEHLYIIQRAGLFGLMDARGEIVLEPQFVKMDICYDMTDYMREFLYDFEPMGGQVWFQAAKDPIQNQEEGYRYALVNPKGEIVTDFNFRDFTYDGYQRCFGYDRDGNIFMVDSEGMTTPGLYSSTGFVDGFMPVQDEATGEIYFLDTHYQKRLGPYQEAQPFSGGLAFVREQTDAFFIDAQGNRALDIADDRYPYQIGFYGDVCALASSINGNIGMIDRQGNDLILPMPNMVDTSMQCFPNGFSIQRNNTAPLILRSPQGKVLDEMPYDTAVWALNKSPYAYAAGTPSLRYDAEGNRTELPYDIDGVLPNGLLTANKAQPENGLKILLHPDGTPVKDAPPFTMTGWRPEASDIAILYCPLLSDELKEYSSAPTAFCYMADVQGNIIFNGHFKNIYYTDGILAEVKTASSYGWVDMQGNWVYRGSNFDTLSD